MAGTCVSWFQLELFGLPMTNVGVLGHALALFIFWPENLTLILHLPCPVEAMNELKRKKQDLDK